MDTSELKARIKDGRLPGVYIFAGEEEYLVKYYLGLLTEAVGTDSPFAVFNNLFFDGEEVDFAAITDGIKAPPVMGDYKLIVWRHADFAGMKERELDALEAVIALTEEHPYTVLAFSAGEDGLDFGTQKKPSKFVSRFGKRINLLRFDRSTENQLYAWLKKHFDSEGVEVNMDTLRALVFRSGRSMEVLSREVAKLSALAHSRGRSGVTPADVEEVSSSTPECDTYAMSNAITELNRQKAYDALEEMKFRRVDPTVIMGSIARAYNELLSVSLLLAEGREAADIESILKMNQYRVRHCIAAAKKYGAKRLSDIVSTLARVDADSKYGGVSGYTAIELFISQNI